MYGLTPSELEGHCPTCVKDNPTAHGPGWRRDSLHKWYLVAEVEAAGTELFGPQWRARRLLATWDP